MNNNTKALLGNLLSFGSLFLMYRLGLGALLKLSSVALILISGIAASILSPKFLVHKNKLYLKFPWKKESREI